MIYVGAGTCGWAAGAAWAADGDARIDDLLGLDRALETIAGRSV